MAGEKVKINIVDISEIDDDFNNLKADTISHEETVEIEENFSDDEDIDENLNDEDISEKYNSIFLNKIFKIINDNKYGIKEDLSELKSRGSEKKDSLYKSRSIDFEKYERIAKLPRNIVEEVYLRGDGFYHRAKYERHKDEGREIKVNKKE